MTGPDPANELKRKNDDANERLNDAPLLKVDSSKWDGYFHRFYSKHEREEKKVRDEVIQFDRFIYWLKARIDWEFEEKHPQFLVQIGSNMVAGRISNETFIHTIRLMKNKKIFYDEIKIFAKESKGEMSIKIQDINFETTPVYQCVTPGEAQNSRVLVLSVPNDLTINWKYQIVSVFSNVVIKS